MVFLNYNLLVLEYIIKKFRKNYFYIPYSDLQQWVSKLFKQWPTNSLEIAKRA